MTGIKAATHSGFSTARGVAGEGVVEVNDVCVQELGRGLQRHM